MTPSCPSIARHSNIDSVNNPENAAWLLVLNFLWFWEVSQIRLKLFKKLRALPSIILAFKGGADSGLLYFYLGSLAISKF